MFPAGWFTSGPDVLWGMSSTYGFVPYEILPVLPAVPFDGSFSWLPPLPARRSPLTYEEEHGDGSLASLPRLRTEARGRGLEIPEVFMRFVATPAIYERVPSITGCFLEFSMGVVRDPSSSRGGMLRFLNDSQGCAFWYLYMTPSGDHCILASDQWLDGGDDEQSALDPQQYFWCAQSLEHFLYRFWLEDEIWTRVKRKQPLSPEQQRYLADAIAARHRLPAPSQRIDGSHPTSC